MTSFQKFEQNDEEQLTGPIEFRVEMTNEIVYEAHDQDKLIKRV